jgi:hypothetical protein
MLFVSDIVLNRVFGRRCPGAVRPLEINLAHGPNCVLELLI